MGYEIPNLMAQSSQGAYPPLKDLCLYLKSKASYVKKLEDNLVKLTADVTTFYSRKKQIDRMLETSVSKEKSEEYEILVKQIEVFFKKYEKFIKKYHKVCQNIPSLTPDAAAASSVIDALQQRKPTILTHKFFTLAKLSRDVERLNYHVSQVTDRVKPENLMLEKQAELVQKKHDDGIDLASINEYVNKILSYLCEDENKSIGIVGLIGVGKTTVMRKLNNRLKDISSSLSSGNTMNSKFDVVIWIDYPKELSTDKIVEMMQDVIIGRLKLNREKDNNIEQNADIISKALCEKKYIMLIDQVSSKIDLDEVGICRKDHMFGKLVVASSNKKIINQMTDQQVKIHTLLNNEAYDLFQNVCGRIFDPRIKHIAERIIDSCGGLPLVIKLVATHLKGEKDENVWSDVKRMLQAETKVPKLLGGVGNAYKLVYDGLEENYMKKCLLFGALFPCDHKIYTDYLVECWMAESFLPLSNADSPELRSGREHGATILKELTDKYLLERCSDKYVKMPVYFRKVALEQKYPGEDNCVICVSGERRLKEENWKTATRMSLICCNSELPENPESKNILTLLLQWNPELVKLGELFFLNMQNLRVLDLNRTGIDSLPTSISSLVNLKSLYLNDCSRLVKLPIEIQRLEKLEFLDVRGTAIPFLPCEIGYMVRLKCLRITFSQNGCHRNRKGKEVELMISPNTIRRLQELEELTIETGCCSQSWNNIADQIVDELISLEKLTTLTFHFPSVYSLEKFVVQSKSWKNRKTHWQNNTFRSFKLSIGCCETQHAYGSSLSGIVADRHLRLSTNEDVGSVKEVLKQASAFELIGHSNVTNLSEFDLENTGALKICIIERCKNLVNIVERDGITQNSSSGGILQCLEKLHLFDLQLLQSIWKGSIFPGSLSNLKVLTLCGCTKLTHVLDHELAKAFSSLKYLKVANCSSLVEVVRVEIPNGQNISEHVNVSDILRKLKTIELVNLPELQSICMSMSMSWNSLREIVTISCSKLRNLSLSNVGKLETIKCESSWWSGLQWPEEEKQQFVHLCEFIVVGSQPSNTNGESSSRGTSVNLEASKNISNLQMCNNVNKPMVGSLISQRQTQTQLVV